MGIDNPDVRFVIHYDLPKTVESYYQETGGPGDGKPAECLLFYGRGDYARLRSMLEHDEGGERSVRIALKKLQDMTGYARRPAPARLSALVFWRNPKSRELRVVRQLRTPCGIHRRHGTGAPDRRVRPATVIHFGIELIYRCPAGKKIGEDQSRTISTGCLHMQPGSGAQKKSTGTGSTIWSGRGILQPGDKYPVIASVRRAAGCSPGPAGSGSRHPCGTSTGFPVSSTGSGEIIDSDPREAEAELFQRLKAVRTSLARESQVPPYVVFTGRSLREMARSVPATGRILPRSPGSVLSSRRNAGRSSSTRSRRSAANRPTDLLKPRYGFRSHYPIPDA